MADLGAADLAFWQQCQTRVAGYLTTNGMIEITLCGLYATTVAALVSLLDPARSAAQRQLVFGWIIPIFSLVVLSLSTRVYSWIEMQLLYLALTGIHPENLTKMVTYEEFKDLVVSEWRKLRIWRRAVLLLRFSIVMFVSMPFNIANIYCYYFFLYTFVALVSIYYAFAHVVPVWRIGLALVPYYLFLTLGCSDVFRLKVIQAELREVICPRVLNSA